MNLIVGLSSTVWSLLRTDLAFAKAFLGAIFQRETSASITLLTERIVSGVLNNNKNYTHLHGYTGSYCIDKVENG